MLPRRLQDLILRMLSKADVGETNDHTFFPYNQLVCFIACQWFHAYRTSSSSCTVGKKLKWLMNCSQSSRKPIGTSPSPSPTPRESCCINVRNSFIRPLICSLILGFFTLQDLRYFKTVQSLVCFSIHSYLPNKDSVYNNYVVNYH